MDDRRMVTFFIYLYFVIILLLASAMVWVLAHFIAKFW